MPASAQSQFSVRGLCKTYGELAIAGFSRTAVSHTKQAVFAVTPNNTSTLTSGHSQTSIDNILNDF